MWLIAGLELRSKIKFLLVEKAENNFLEKKKKTKSIFKSLSKCSLSFFREEKKKGTKNK